MALSCCNCLFAPPPTYTPSFGPGSAVRAQPAPAPASSVPNLAVESEAQQRRIFPTTDFAYGFHTNDFQTPAGSQSSLVRLCCVRLAKQPMLRFLPTLDTILMQFVNNNQVLATLPGDGVGQNLITLEPCAINQPHVHPRGTEISHLTKGTSSQSHAAYTCIVPMYHLWLPRSKLEHAYDGCSQGYGHCCELHNKGIAEYC